MAVPSGYFRSKKRDAETDTARVAPILDEVQIAIRKAKRELTGLARRIREATEQSAFLFGNELEVDANLNSVSKIELRNAENTITRGEARHRYLERQIASLVEAESILAAIVRPGGQPSTADYESEHRSKPS
jgi:hypothetical protein